MIIGVEFLDELLNLSQISQCRFLKLKWRTSLNHPVARSDHNKIIISCYQL